MRIERRRDMDLAKLLEMQKELDNHIIKAKQLEGQDLFPGLVLALQVELGELANAWQGFKHWKENTSPKDETLEEYADCLSFILSLANLMEYKADDLYTWDDSLEGSTIDLFNELYLLISQFRFKEDRHVRKDLFKTITFIFFNMGEQRLGFTWSQIVDAYIAKNAINHKRQESGY
jgi:dimeric dUTPase (all-alpha-NTP-PPase superfamily)